MASNNTDLSFYAICSRAPFIRSITIAQFLVRICSYTPLSVFILHHSWQRWRRRRRSLAKASHSEVFIFHLASINLLFSLGSALYLCGEYVDVYWLTKVGTYVNALIFPSEVCFHVLTCVERYLAVVHPVTYRALKQSRGVRIRNVSIGVIWIAGVGWIIICDRSFPSVPDTQFLCLLVFAVVVVLFCSFSVLRALIRPGPGDRRGVDRSKLKAFYTVLAILVVLLLFFLGMTASLALIKQEHMSSDTRCLVVAILNWFPLPGGLVLPAMFVLKAGKQACCH